MTLRPRRPLLRKSQIQAFVAALACCVLSSTALSMRATPPTETRASPRFVPLFWRIATADAVILGQYTQSVPGHRLVLERCLRGRFDIGRPLVFFTAEKLPLETEPLGLAPGVRAVFLLRESQDEDGQAIYVVSQSGGSRGAFPIEDPMPTFSTGVYEKSLADVDTETWKQFLERLTRIGEAVDHLDELLARYDHPLRGDSEVGAYELFPALARVRVEDLSRALEYLENVLAEERRDWVRSRALAARKILRARALR